MDQTILILTNLPDEATAVALAHRLVEHGLAACVNRLPGVRSVYRWQGRIEESAEVSLMIKSTQARYAELEKAIKSWHPYQLPEIIAVPIIGGSPEYLDWIMQQTTKKDDDVDAS